MTPFLLGLAAGAAGTGLVCLLRIRAKDRRREALWAFAAHELASPLTGMRLTLRTFQGGFEKDLPEEQRRWLDILSDQLGTLSDTSSDLGDLAHLEFGRRIKLRPEGFDLGGALDRAAERCRGPGERWGVSIAFEKAAARAHGDADRIERLLRALLGHAVKFSKQPGSVGARVFEDGLGPAVEVLFDPVDPAGPAPSDLLNRYFPAQAGKTLRLTGIGLCLAEEVARRLGGSLEGGVSPDGRHRFLLRLARPSSS